MLVPHEFDNLPKFTIPALKFFSTFSSTLASSHSATLHHLSTLRLPSHVQNDESAQRFRNEKYAIRMSRSGFGLLVGWLTEGVGGEASGAGEGFSGDRGKRGRAAVMRVVNNHLRFDGNFFLQFCMLPAFTANTVISSSAAAVSNAWEESTGLLSSLIPQANGATPNLTNPQAFNASKGDLKLGPAPMSEELRNEMERVLREQAMVDRDPTAQYDIHYTRPAAIPGIAAPSEVDLLPHPLTFKTIDVKREVEKVRDAKKRIRLEPSSFTAIDLSSPQAGVARARALPSVCAYTLHDVAEGWVFF
jgi:transcription initiation factor TFIID subunit 5